MVQRDGIRQPGEGEGYKTEFTGEREMGKQKLFCLPISCISAMCLMQASLLLALYGVVYVQLILWTSS